MKKLNLLSIGLLIGLLTNAQPTEYPVSQELVGLKFKMPPAIKNLDESLKFYVQYPEKLTYHKDGRAMYALGPISPALNFDAKQARKPEGVDYTFRIICPGLSVSPAVPQPVYFEENRPATYATPAANVKGFIMKIRYSMPVTIEVVNKEGAVEKTFLFNTDSAEWIYHRNFLAELQTEIWKPRKNTMPFATEQEAAAAFTKNQEAIYTRMESNTWFYTLEFCKRELEIAYSNYKLSSSHVYVILLRKKDKEEVPELAEILKNQKSLMNGLEDEKTIEASLAGLQKNLTYFEDMADGIRAFGPGMQRLITSNAAWCALLTHQLDKAAKYFNRYAEIEKDRLYIDLLVRPYTALFSDYRNHQLLASKEKTVKPIEELAVTAP